MEESLLHFLWQFQKFNTNLLRLTDGRTLTVFSPGNHNEDAGPDFSQARIKIANLQWVGKVEIHIRSSDWLRHGHQHDQNYDGVILHVVWKADREIFIDESPIPMLELSSIVDPEILAKYKRRLPAENNVPCLSQIKNVDAVYIHTMLTRTGTERLKRKADRILEELKRVNNDWDEVSYRVLAANFGFSVNKPAFQRLAEQLPFHLLKKELSNVKSTRALLWGQAGFLKLNRGKELLELSSEHLYKQNKYQLPDSMNSSLWKFSKLRPANSPFVRMDQLGSLLYQNPRLFSSLIKLTDGKFCLELLRCQSSTRVSDHPLMGKSAAQNILINTIAPLLAAYAYYLQEDAYRDRAMSLLEQIPAENNRITRSWYPEMPPKDAFESQAQIELISNYCFKRRCLRCTIGVKILNG